MLEQTHTVMRREKTIRIETAQTIRAITQFLPVNELSVATDLMFGHPTSRKALCTYIEKKMDIKGIPKTNLQKVVKAALEYCFSPYYRAHMFVGEPEAKRLIRVISPKGTITEGWSLVSIQ